MTVDDLLRVARTLRGLHPLQIVARPLRWAQARALRNMSGALAPRLRPFSAPVPPSLGGLIVSERARHALRVSQIEPETLLGRYERAYGYEGENDATQHHSVALHPFPASIRGRNLAVFARAGEGVSREALARASRAVLLQPEIHLLGNHLLENGLALVCAGAAAQGTEATLWWQVGKAILRWQLPRQFLTDGGHFERSASYHLSLTLGLLHAIELSRAAGRTVPEEWLAFALRASKWIHAVRAPDGSYPLFNDSSLDAGPFPDAVLALAGDLGIWEPVAGRRLPGVDVLADTGWILAHASDGSWLAFDAGPDGAPDQPGHVHADALGFELWVGGERAVVDFGVATYQLGDERARTRATRSHSTLELEGQDSCEVWSAFRVGRRQGARVQEARVCPDGSIVTTASHDGYRYLPGAPTHVRTIRLKAGRVEVVDRILGGPAQAVSRLRCDARVGERLHVSGSHAVERAGDVWYPRYSDPLPAVLYSQRVEPGASASFVIEW